jgi:hypothetical protein
MPMPNPPTGLQNNTPPPDQTDEATTQLEQTAHHLAQQHQQITSANFPPHLLERLSTQEATIEAVHQYFVQASQEERDYSAAAEWILDNYYVVQQALRQVKRDLPSAYYKELPKLADGRAWHGLPRVFALARHFTIQENCYTDVHRFARFLQAYQQETPLKMGEVWALPIMLRFCLLECLAQTAVRVTRQTEASEQMAPMLQFSVTAADTDVIANAITGLRQLASYDWNTFFEESSQVEQILRQDPAGLYGRMTFHTPRPIPQSGGKTGPGHRPVRAKRCPRRHRSHPARRHHAARAQMWIPGPGWPSRWPPTWAITCSATPATGWLRPSATGPIRCGAG